MYATNKLVDNMLISNQDKIILKQAAINNNYNLLKQLSFYSHKGKTMYLNEYEYEYIEGDIYVTTIHIIGGGGIFQIFLDEDKKIIFNSRWWFNNGKGIPSLINHLNIFMNHVYNKLQLNDIPNIGKDIIAIQAWFNTYGHYLDEMFVLSDFYNNLNKTHFKIMREYDTTKQENNNYKYISDLLFENNYINPYTFNAPILKFNNLFLIKHSIIMNTFHSFPINVKNMLINKLCLNTQVQVNENNFSKIFITRSIAKHMPRNLHNQIEIEDFFKTKLFNVLNPENIEFKDFINILQKANVIIITWGSALTNLIFCNPGTKVIILKSQSYENESIVLFNKIIQNNSLIVKVILHKNNEIDLNELNETIQLL